MIDYEKGLPLLHERALRERIAELEGEIKEIREQLDDADKSNADYARRIRNLLDGRYRSEQMQIRLKSMIRKCVDQLDVSEYCDCKGCVAKRELVSEVNKILKAGDQ